LMNVAKHAQCREAAVSLARCNGELCIQVQDRGVGFDPEALAADGSSMIVASKFGLFSIRERMRALGGSFQLDSVPGRGTTAILTLPLGGGAAAETLRVMREASCVQGQKTELTNASRITDHASRIRVLLVDDHAMVRQGLRSVLETYADVDVVGEAADGDEAVALAERWRPAVVVMDINMPKMNGVEATACIKARFPGMVVIGLSVNAGGGNQEAMTSAGAALLLTKEAAVDQLYQAIQDVLSEKRSERRSVEQESFER
jgi:CheY-like chemotaxis protein